ncbi:9282_t:CDS:2, partial [Dentiscutata erythropus]
MSFNDLERAVAIDAGLRDERVVAIDAVLRASKVCQSVFNHLVTSDTLIKKDKTPVTIADFGAQAVVNSILYKFFPNDPVVGEEDSKRLKGDDGKEMRDKVLSLANSALDTPLNEKETLLIEELTLVAQMEVRMWSLDPIDETNGFLRGEEGQYAVGLSLIIDGVVHLSVIGCPNYPVDFNNPKGERGCVFIAVKGQGAFQRNFSSTGEAPIHVADVPLSPEVTYCVSLGADHAKLGYNDKIASLLGIIKPALQMDSMSRYCAVARGDVNIYLRLPYDVNYEEKIWDHAPGSLLVAEAGGIVTNIDNEPLDFSLGRTLGKVNKGFVVTSSKIHEQVIDA